MKKFLLMIILVCPAAFAANAQCTPNPLYADSAFGVWPDTIVGFTPAMEGVWWTDTLDFKIPTDGGDIDPNFQGFQIDSVSLNTISNLPPGITYECNSNTPSPCTFLGGWQGCGLLEGTPTTAGTYEMDIEVTAYTFLGVVIPVPYTFTGYMISVDPVGIEEQGAGNIAKVEQNVPNPFIEKTRIAVYLRDGADIEFSVHDMVGKTLFQSVQRGVPGKNELVYQPNGAQSGVYLYTINSGGESITRRMIIK